MNLYPLQNVTLVLIKKVIHERETKNKNLYFKLEITEKRRVQKYNIAIN